MIPNYFKHNTSCTKLNILTNLKSLSHTVIITLALSFVVAAPQIVLRGARTAVQLEDFAFAVADHEEEAIGRKKVRDFSEISMSNSEILFSQLFPGFSGILVNWTTRRHFRSRIRVLSTVARIRSRRPRPRPRGVRVRFE